MSPHLYQGALEDLGVLKHQRYLPLLAAVVLPSLNLEVALLTLPLAPRSYLGQGLSTTV